MKKQKQYQESILEIIIPTFEENSTLPCLGKNYNLRINKQKPINTIRFENGEFVIDTISSDINEERKLYIRDLYENWLKRMAQRILMSRVKIYAKKVGVNIPKISVKNSLKSRWASLTKVGAINFNVHLMKAPRDVIDYIILHEICHLKIKGHSHHYWNLVYRYMPDYQEKINWLNVNGRVLIGSDKITSDQHDK